MRSFKQTMTEQFCVRMKSELPDFEYRVFSEDQKICSFTKPGIENRHFHIIPSVGRNYTFSVEIGVMDTPNSPIFARIGLPDSSPNEHGIRFALSHLWSVDASSWAFAFDDSDFAWNDGHIRLRPAQIQSLLNNLGELPKETGSRQAFAIVEDVIVKIKEYAIPFFDRFA